MLKTGAIDATIGALSALATFVLLGGIGKAKALPAPTPATPPSSPPATPPPAGTQKPRSGETWMLHLLQVQGERSADAVHLFLSRMLASVGQVLDVRPNAAAPGSMWAASVRYDVNAGALKQGKLQGEGMELDLVSWAKVA